MRICWELLFSTIFWSTQRVQAKKNVHNLINDEWLLNQVLGAPLGPLIKENSRSTIELVI